MTKEGLKNRVLNGGRGSGQSLRLLCEVYENRIAELEKGCEETQELLDKQIEATYNLDKENEELEEQCEDWKSDHEHNLELMEGLNNRISELEKENAGLKADNDARKFAMTMSEKVEKQLREQIEKMKCCQNCKSEDNDYMEKPCCDCNRCLGDIKRNGTSDKWEIKENE